MAKRHEVTIYGPYRGGVKSLEPTPPDSTSDVKDLKRQLRQNRDVLATFALDEGQEFVPPPWVARGLDFEGWVMLRTEAISEPTYSVKAVEPPKPEKKARSRKTTARKTTAKRSTAKKKGGE